MWKESLGFPYHRNAKGIPYLCFQSHYTGFPSLTLESRYWYFFTFVFGTKWREGGYWFWCAGNITSAKNDGFRLGPGIAGWVSSLSSGVELRRRRGGAHTHAEERPPPPPPHSPAVRERRVALRRWKGDKRRETELPQITKKEEENHKIRVS